MSAANKALAKGIRMMKAATPDGSTFPRNEAEWSKAVAALEQLGYVTHLNSGMPKPRARELARTHGDKAGRRLLESGQQADRVRHE